MKAREIPNAFHVSLLRLFTPDEFERTEPPPPPLQFEGHHYRFEVESIVAVMTFVILFALLHPFIVIRLTV